MTSRSDSIKISIARGHVKSFLRTVIIIVASLALLAPVHSATLPDEQFQIPTPAEEQMRGYYINEITESTQNSSTYISTWVGERIGWSSNQEAPTDVVVCTASDAPDCELRIIQQFLAILPYCDNATTLTCIEEVFAEKNGQRLNVERLSELPER